MSVITFYTAEELAAATEKLLKTGHPIWVIANDPKCPADVVKKMRRLKKLGEAKKGGLR